MLQEASIASCRICYIAIVLFAKSVIIKKRTFSLGEKLIKLSISVKKEPLKNSKVTATYVILITENHY